MATQKKRDDARPATKAPPETDRAGVLEALLSGLEEVSPGLQVLDRELVFEEGARADLVAADPSGRLVLILLASEEPDRAVLEALDALNFARSHTELLVRHLGGRPLRTDLDPRTILVNLEGRPTVVERLRPLLGQGIEVYGVRSLKSAAGERSYLVPLAAGAAGAASEPGVESFVAALPRALQGSTRELLRRLSRLDEEVAPTLDRNSLVWRYRGDVLVRLERAGDRLFASMGPNDEPRVFGGQDDLDGLVEGALARLVQVLERRPTPLDDTPDDEPAGRSEETEPLLTPEEIEAFRE